MALVRAAELGSSPSVVLEMARRTGALPAAGLGVFERPVPSSPRQFRALVDGELHVGHTNPDNVLAYRFDPQNPLGQLLDARIVSGIDRGLGLGLWAGPGVHDDLLGAVIGADAPDSGFALARSTLLERRGLGRDDYEVVQLGSTPQRLQALIDGGCAATMLGAGNELTAESAGCTLIASVRDELFSHFATVLCVVRDEYLEASHDLADVLTSMAACIVGSRLACTAVAAAASRLGLDGDLAQRYVERLADPGDGLIVDGTVDPAALRTVLDLRRRWLPRVVDGRDVLAESWQDPGLVIRR